MRSRLRTTSLLALKYPLKTVSNLVLERVSAAAPSWFSAWLGRNTGVRVAKMPSYQRVDVQPSYMKVS